MKYRVEVNETLKSTRFIEIEYTGDINVLLGNTERNTQNCYEVGYELSKLGVKIIKDNDLSLSDIQDWSTDSLEYCELKEE